ncbi:MAG: aconitate hydratase AcnA, partial [Deltaproteobacteria bacterium]|nr:aconitate hydratase AcnA [Deltaproteobacteria bacterium]
VPAVVDLAAMRDAMAELGGDPARINPLVPASLVIDHSVQVDVSSRADAIAQNAEFEFARNHERYVFLRWGAKAFDNFRVIPPASGIVHQVNLEYLATAVAAAEIDGQRVLFPDTLVGTDSHTTMINGLGILAWGVGGIEAEAVMLGQPIYMLTPAVVGFKLMGALPEGATATDLVLTVTARLREHGVVGKFVEFHGPGLSNLSLPDRATLANMAPEYGATMGFFPFDAESLRYLELTGRPKDIIDRAERYTKAQGLFRTDDAPDPAYATVIEFDMSTVEPSLAGPKRPQDRIALSQMKSTFRGDLQKPTKERGFDLAEKNLAATASATIDGESDTLRHGSIVLTAITSCTNTSNPAVLLGAGLVAKKAVEKGLSIRPSVKRSLAPGSRAVTEYLKRAGLTPYLEELGFHTVGYGCTTCIGNSGPLVEPVVEAINESALVTASVTSGNRNFEGRVNPHTKANYLTSPPLVVAYALAGTVDLDLTTEPIGKGKNGEDVFLKDIWPTSQEIGDLLASANDPEVYAMGYHNIENANERWNAIPVSGDAIYAWDEASTYIQEPPFFVGMSLDVEPIAAIENANVLVKVGDTITTDHISPAGSFSPEGPAGQYLIERGVEKKDFN